MNAPTTKPFVIDPALSLGAKQRIFTLMVAHLILKAYEMGYQISLGEAWRTPQQAQANAAAGRGISNSLHLDRLAIDLNLFTKRDGRWVWLTKTEDHKPLGEYWESIGGTWGGRFNDGNHYSLAHGGRK